MTKTETLAAVRDSARNAALYLQIRAGDMTGTELYASAEYIPAFAAAVAARNMLSRTTDFVCRSSAGRVVQLRQPYDSTIYPGEPETLPAQWGFKWSTDPAKALPFVALATSPYGVGDCCTHGGKTWRSKMTNNVYSPADYPAGWEEVTS